MTTRVTISKPLHILIAILIVSACTPTPRDRVVGVKSEDAAMNEAMQKARDTVGTFIESLKSPKPNRTHFFIKVKLTDGDNVEHMWLNNVSYDNASFYGQIANDPMHIKSVKPGDRVRAAPGDISDWMFVEDRQLIGGYTIRVLRDRMSPEERKQFDSQSWFTIDDTQK